MAKQKMIASEAIVETLVAEGIEHVSGIVGSAFMDVLDLMPAAESGLSRYGTSKARLIWKMVMLA